MLALVLSLWITLATVTRYSDMWQSLLTCLGHLGWRDTDRIVSISCPSPKVAKASIVMTVACRSRWQFCFENFANVNDPLQRNEVCEYNTWLGQNALGDSKKLRLDQKHFTTVVQGYVTFFFLGQKIFQTFSLGFLPPKTAIVWRVFIH